MQLLEKLEAARSAYLWLPFLTFGYLSWDLLGLTEPHLAVLGLTGPFWVLLGLNGFASSESSKYKFRNMRTTFESLEYTSAAREHNNI